MLHNSVLVAYKGIAWVAAAAPGVVVSGTRLGHRGGGAKKHFGCCIIEDYN